MTCAKAVVKCAILTPQGVAMGYNGCAAPQEECPRTKGEGYDKCSHICKQEGHAEIMALQNAQQRGYDTKGATAVVYHWRVCDACQRALRAAGIDTTIIIDR